MADAPAAEPSPAAPGYDQSAIQVLEGLEAGPHEVIALVGDHLHVPLSPPVADTVRFVVR